MDFKLNNCSVLKINKQSNEAKTIYESLIKEDPINSLHKRNYVDINISQTKKNNNGYNEINDPFKIYNKLKIQKVKSLAMLL